MEAAAKYLPSTRGNVNVLRPRTPASLAISLQSAERDTGRISTNSSTVDEPRAPGDGVFALPPCRTMQSANVPDVAAAGPGRPGICTSMTPHPALRGPSAARPPRHGAIPAASECTPTLPRFENDLRISHGSWGFSRQNRRIRLSMRRRQVEMPREANARARGVRAATACPAAAVRPRKGTRRGKHSHVVSHSAESVWLPQPGEIGTYGGAAWRRLHPALMRRLASRIGALSVTQGGAGQGTT